MSEVIGRVGEVDFYSKELTALKNLRVNWEPRSSQCLLEMMSDINSIAKDIADVSKPSRDVLVEAIELKMNGIVTALLRGTILERSEL